MWLYKPKDQLFYCSKGDDAISKWFLSSFEVKFDSVVSTWFLPNVEVESPSGKVIWGNSPDSPNISLDSSPKIPGFHPLKSRCRFTQTFYIMFIQFGA